MNKAAEYRINLENNSRYAYQSDAVTIKCKECHRVLCFGSDIIKKGTDYICINKDFETKVTHMKQPEHRFRLDSNIGKWKLGKRMILPWEKVGGGLMTNDWEGEKVR